ncbi:uncharacterized protein LOC107788259 [Nicotiana tabacum]|uniref:Uncharacterized protein LOC107788259 n=2 Tax=Nicotiana tabacum TaxID=4097 RepID=A0A1S3ZM30_TOBAC|nr:PREDICTED: uncharacterized protein LOC107788259 isoform X2 [Nicotiana tabacum]
MHYDLLVRGPLCIDWNIWISWSHCSLVNPSLLTSVDTELAATPLVTIIWCLVFCCIPWWIPSLPSGKKSRRIRAERA